MAHDTILVIVFSSPPQLGKLRMTNPCRSMNCTHLQCFDASIYLQMNERSVPLCGAYFVHTVFVCSSSSHHTTIIPLTHALYIYVQHVHVRVHCNLLKVHCTALMADTYISWHALSSFKLILAPKYLLCH